MLSITKICLSLRVVLKKSALKQKLVQSFTKSFIITFEFDNAYFALVEVLLMLYNDMKKIWKMVSEKIKKSNARWMAMEKMRMTAKKKFSRE